MLLLLSQLPRAIQLVCQLSYQNQNIRVNLYSEEQLKAELASAGMTQGSIDGLISLTNRFATRYPLVESNKEATDKFISEYTNDANNFIKAMSPEDQKIYNAHLKKYGLA